MFSFDKARTRITLAIITLLLIGGTLLYSNYLADQLATKEKNAALLWANAIKLLGGNDSIDAYQQFVFEIIQDTVSQIPGILTDSAGNYVSDMNLSFRKDIPDEERQRKVAKMMEMMEVLKVSEQQKVYYGESPVLTQLRWYPYIQVIVASVFLGIVLLGFAVAKRNEQNRIWVGLAKETAHQLGTPVSSLMAWIDLLRAKYEDDPEEMEMVEDMEHDIYRLNNIAERFSKIGSKPELKHTNMSDLLEKAAGYMRKRMGAKISLTVDNQIRPESKVEVNAQLFEWVIENLLKNALDAMEGKEGKIIIKAMERDKEVIIDISDTGKGMSSNMFRKVFEPGFTTKKRGWGLGLSLSKRIIEMYHEGKIFVKEAEVGKGTTFRIILPK